MRSLYFTLVALCFNVVYYAQVGVNVTSPKANLHMVAETPSDPESYVGFGVPVVTAFPTTDPTDDQNGMLVYYSNIPVIPILKVIIIGTHLELLGNI